MKKLILSIMSLVLLSFLVIITGKTPTEASSLEIYVFIVWATLIGLINDKKTSTLLVMTGAGLFFTLDKYYDFIGVEDPIVWAEGKMYFGMEIRENYKNAAYFYGVSASFLVLIVNIVKNLITLLWKREPVTLLGSLGVKSMYEVIVLITFIIFWVTTLLPSLAHV